MKLWLYHDAGGWGEALLPIALERGHDARLFVEAHEPDEGAVFVHMHHHPDTRDYDKELMATLAMRGGLRLCPDPRSAILYDDKAEQLRQLAEWMPQTILVRSSRDVPDALARLKVPLISKTSEGAGSKNVRLVETVGQARDEADQAFGSGIPCHYDRRQTGYLLWQEFLAGNEYDFRVIAVGRERLILRRGNREDRPMASGSGNEMPIQWPDDEASEVLAFADEIFAAEGFRWCGVDIVRDHQRGRWRLLEVTVGWPLGKMGEHHFVSGRTCDDFWPVVMDEIEAGTVFA